MAIFPAWGKSSSNVHSHCSTTGRFHRWHLKNGSDLLGKKWSSVCPEVPVCQSAWGLPRLGFLPSSLFSVLCNHPLLLLLPSLAAGQNTLQRAPSRQHGSIWFHLPHFLHCLIGMTFWSCLEEHIVTVFPPIATADISFHFGTLWWQPCRPVSFDRRQRSVLVSQ